MEERAMKKFLLSVLLFSLAATLSANNRNRSELRISLFDGAAFNISVGNLVFNNQAPSYTINNLAPGHHFVEIVKVERYRNWRGHWRVKYNTVFADYINIARASVVVGEINRRGKFVVTAMYAINGGWGNPSNQDYWNSGNNNYWHGQQGIAAMNHQSFSALVNVIRNASFESNKLDIAKQALSMNWVTSSQVRQLLYLFSFESSKLELAKYAFSSTIDPENYFMVHDAFNFSSSSRELNNFIAASF